MSRPWLKRCAIGAMTVVMTVSSLPMAAFADPNGYNGGGNAFTNVNGEQVTIGNDAITRTFSIAGDKLKTVEIYNNRAETTLFPEEGSEEFIIKRTKKDAAGQQPIDQTGWTAIADSEEKVGEGAGNGLAQCLIDNNTNTIWHTAYKNDAGQDLAQKPGMPHQVVIDLKAPTSFASFAYDPRHTDDNGVEINGNIKKYTLWVSTAETAPDMKTDEGWTQVAEGEFDYAGNKGEAIHVNIDDSKVELCKDVRFVRFVAVSNVNNKEFAGGEEFDLYAEKYVKPVEQGMFLKTSDLTLAEGQPVETDTTATINKQEKTGKKLSFKFQPVKFNGVDYTITENIVVYNGDHYMRKYMEISVPKDQAANAEIDYIDLESLNIPASDPQWTIPLGQGGIVEMEEFKANLGQPFYADGMFFGCEFPETDTQIIDQDGKKNARPRYYTGKTLERLALDGQASDHDGVVTYQTWQTVAGAARSTDNSVIQSDFFDYINDIAVPSEFRIQYNSWFDNMMNIDNKNILDSFKAIDKNLVENGVRPLDDYVVDDGWNNYNPTDRSVDVSKSGVGKNKTGFWEFNSKFPDGFSSSSELVQALGSHFGTWIGPRGGYNFQNHMADILAAHNFGSKAPRSNDIDVADRRYVKKFQELAIKWQQDYKLNYWKWDGFANKNQYTSWNATDGQPSRVNEHMVGGTHNMYHVTDLWEAWIDLFEAVRAAGDEQGLYRQWISLTCYVNPSPWFLQWANSLWLQCGPDQAGAGVSMQNKSDSQMDRQMNARDAAYYSYIKDHQFQFPLAHIYNHDPVYGKSGTAMTADTATAEQFQNYLYTIAGRGTAFWELYFSDSILDAEKYEVAAEFLEWAEANFHMLRNAKMFGKSPAEGIKLETGPSYTSSSVEIWANGPYNTYGYSGFDGDEGIITVRNAEWRKSQDISFTFDDATLGVKGEKGDKYNYVVERHYVKSGQKTTITDEGTFTIGENVTWNMSPEESLTIYVSKKKDAKAPVIAKVATDGSKTVTVQMSEKVKGDAVFAVNGKNIDASKVKRSADDTTYHVTLDEAPASGEELKITVEGLTDMAGNKLAENTASTVYHKDGVVASRCASRMVGSAKKLADAKDSLQSKNGMGVFSYIELTGTGSIVSQDGAYELGINAEGKAYFTLGGATATSNAVVNDGKPHTIAGVKENNGIVKVYVDGQLAASDYKAENKDFATPASNIMLGSEGVAGKASAKVFDSAIAYDEVAKLNADVVPNLEDRNLALGKNASAKWTKDGSSAEKGADGAMSLAVDGRHDNSKGGSYAEFGVDGRNESSYMEIDLGRAYELKQINLWRYFDETGRHYKNTVVAVSEDGKFDADAVIYNADADNVHGFGAGSEKSYEETKDGHTFKVPEGTRARYVRVYMNGAKKGNWSGTTNHVVECEVIGHDVAISGSDLDTAALAERIDAVNAEIVKGAYTTSSVAAVQKVLDEAELVLDCGKTQDEVAKALKSLEGIESKLVLRANLDAAKALLEKVDALNPDDYTAESFKAVEDTKTPVEQAVADNSDVSQEQLDKFVADLQAAYDALKKVEQPGPEKPEPPVVDPEQKPEQKPTTKPEQKPGSGAELPKTGDDSMLPIAAAGVAGVALVGAAVVLNKRRRAE